MLVKRRFGVIGGDRRQAILARLLEADGHDVRTYGLEGQKAEESAALEKAAEAEIVILPLPLCRGDGVLHCEAAPMPTAELFRRLRPGQTALAGQVKPEQRREAELAGVRLLDYFLREELTVANAAATAEGAVQTAMERLDRTLLGMDCLVLGFGRIGKLLAFRLHGLGARVTAAARNPADLAWIRAYGWTALPLHALREHPLDRFGAVFGTIPSPVLDEPLLARLSADCLCVELASTPGIDLAAAERMGLSCVWGRSLPGRLVPRTAAEAIRDAVYHMI